MGTHTPEEHHNSAYWRTMNVVGHINLLSNEVLLCIFDRLTLKDKARASQVCVRWNLLINVTYRGQLAFEFKEYQDAVWPRQLVLKSAKNVLKKLLRATQANLTGIRTFDRSDAKLLADNCPGLCSINLSRAYIRPQALVDLARACSRLNTLILNGCELSDSNEISATLSICGHKLRRLELDGFPENAYALRPLDSQLVTSRLHTMSLANCGLYYVDYRYSRLFQLELRRLDCSIYEEPRRTINMLIGICPRLEHLTLDLVEPNGDLTMERELCFENLTHLKYLKHLTLDGAVDYVADLNDANLAKLVQNCPFLDTLEIGPQSGTLSGKILALLPRSTPRMCCLRLTRLKMEPDEFRCITCLPRLTKASFDYCHMTNLSNHSLLIGKTILDCVRLNELSLMGMTPEQDEKFWTAQMTQYDHCERKKFDFVLHRDSVHNLLISVDNDDYDMFAPLEPDCDSDQLFSSKPWAQMC